MYKSRKLYSPNAANEILAEFEQYLCPQAYTIYKAVGYILTLLPNNIPGQIDWLDKIYDI